MEQEIRQFIEEAELVLVGIGEEFDGEKRLSGREDYRKLRNALEEADKAWAIPALNRYFLLGGALENTAAAVPCRELTALQNLSKILQGKNYFVVSVATNDLVWDSGLREDRIVAPCGGSRKKQCGAGCSVGGGSEGREKQRSADAPEGTGKEPGKVWDLTKEDENLLSECARTGSWTSLELGNCPYCGAPLVFNNVYTEHYAESGYLDRWSLYTKWLMGTMNRKVCILELGVGLQCPSVIRFPFERLAYYNRKATFVRIHESLCQLPEGMGDRGLSIRNGAIEALLGE